MELERYLVLNNFFLEELGYTSFEELRDSIRDQQEGYDQDGRSYFVGVLIGRRDSKISRDKLLSYDRSIKDYVNRLRESRRMPSFNLKYFQYLSVLLTEIYLERMFPDERRLLNDLNVYTAEFNRKNNNDIGIFTLRDLHKLAYWIATGGGKTIIMHINYWQIRKYTTVRYDNILLITPNSELSKQHSSEMTLSGIPCKLYDGNPENLGTDDGQVLIVDIFKLTEEKRGPGVTIDTSSFDGKNLVFIDEGHKGQRTEEQTWKNLREGIGKTGFIFEYSATFGQVISDDPELLEEYSKSILFNYSYKYFYSDGYGKDFYVYNLKETLYTEDYRDILLTANLLTYYEQLVLFDENEPEARSNGYERPLWVFVGSKVSGGKLESDIVKIVRFFKKILENKSQLKETLTGILDGNSGLEDVEGNDLFNNKFIHIKHNFNIEELYEKVFGSQGRLNVVRLRNADGEFGLRVGERYFGVLNIGDAAALTKSLRTSGVEVSEDSFTTSLFDSINERNSRINILIGARKFIEGWDSWRVSNMSLINMGRTEGPQIIQIFGRGVRLKGRNFSLKRTNSGDYFTRSLETLSVFGLNADYMNAFLESIKSEGIEFGETEIPLKLNVKEQRLEELHTIRTRDDFRFTDYLLSLKIDEDILKNLEVDFRPRISLAHGLDSESVDVKENRLQVSDETEINVLDKESIYLRLLNYKLSQGYYNLLVDKDTIYQMVESGNYNIIISPEQSAMRNFSDTKKREDMIVSYLQSYIDKFYRISGNQKSMSNLALYKLDKDDGNLNFGHYSIKYPKEGNLVSEISSLMGNLSDLYIKDNSTLPTVHFDKHLYSPLVVYSKRREDVTSTPVKLNEGESKFVIGLRKFIEERQGNLDGYEIFLLRNQSRRGVGFFQLNGFYPDFIMWLKNPKTEKIIFLDPKGIRNLGSFKDEKIEFCNSVIKEVEDKIRKGIEIDVHLDSYILSVTKPGDVTWATGIKEDEFERHKIIFMTKEDWTENLWSKLTK